MNVYQRFWRRAGGWAPVRWLLSKILTPLDVALRNTRFAPSKFGVDMPLCYLTTTGRHSGEPRVAPLLFADLGNEVIGVAATNFGTESHPGWSYNLDAQPEATVEIDGTSRKVVARRATDDEGAAVIEQLSHTWPAYDTYQEIAPRDIRIYVLAPSS